MDRDINGQGHGRAGTGTQMDRDRLLIIVFHIMFVVNAVNFDPYGIWTTLKMVLTLLNVNHYRLLKS